MCGEGREGGGCRWEVGHAPGGLHELEALQEGLRELQDGRLAALGEESGRSELTGRDGGRERRQEARWGVRERGRGEGLGAQRGR